MELIRAVGTIIPLSINCRGACEEAIVATMEDQVRQSILRFYQALDGLLLNRGIEAMTGVWHRGEFVSTVHPFGHWAVGWDEVLATWEETAAIFAYYRGHADRQDGIGAIYDLRVTVVGDMAIGIGVYKSLLYFPDRPRPLSVNCTNVLLRTEEGWKMIHHHPDQAPLEYQEAIGRLVS